MQNWLWYIAWAITFALAVLKLASMGSYSWVMVFAPIWGLMLAIMVMVFAIILYTIPNRHGWR